MTAYSIIGAKLVDQGYSAIPVLPGTKRPGAMSNGRWFGDMDWQRYCDRLPSEIETGIWSRWPDAGVCVALGAASGGLVAIDVDTDNLAIQRAIESAIPPSPVQKAGRKGYTAFYRASPNVLSRAFNVNGDRALDLLAHGKQTILPPTLHPETGKPYYWLTEDTLESLSPDRLPLLPDDVADKLGAVLAPFGYYAPVERPASSDGADSLFREVNDRALERLDSWVPGLGISAKRHHNGTWRGVAIWKGAENANVSFSPQGIKDFGSDTGMTAIDAVMAAHSSDFATAEKWLRDKLGFREPPPVRLLQRAKPVAEPELVVVKVEPAPIYAPPAALDPFDPKNAGGLLHRIADWILETSIRPSREFAMLASIGFIATFAGRRYVGPTGLGCNMYLVGVARTGAGKNAPLAAAKTLIFGANMPWLYGSGDPASDSAIERVVRRSPSCLLTIDEIGVWLQEMSGRNAASFQKGKRKSLLELYSASTSGGIWTGKDRAGSEVESSAAPVYVPTVSFLGMSTQTEFYKGITEDNLRDGLVARLTVIESQGRGKAQRVPPIVKLPHELIGAIRDAAEAWPAKGNLAAANARSAVADPFLHAVQFESEAVRSRWEKVCDWQDSVIDDDEGQAGIVGRAGEQTLKLACIRAVSRSPAAPVITAEDLEWAWAFVGASLETIQEGVKRYMSGSEFETLWKCMLQHVKDSGDKGLNETQLMRKPGVSKTEPRKVKEAIGFLSNTGLWKYRDAKRGKRFFPPTAEETAEQEAA